MYNYLIYNFLFLFVYIFLLIVGCGEYCVNTLRFDAYE